MKPPWCFPIRLQFRDGSRRSFSCSSICLHDCKSYLDIKLYSFVRFLAILLGSFKVGYEEIRDAIYRCDDAIITENVLANFIKLLPTNEQVYLFLLSQFF